ncbi:MAG: acyltransferase family protein [Leadbetterella sp.]
MKVNEIPSERNCAIDSLRGISILAVILLHLNIRIPFSGTYLGSILPKPIYKIFFWSGYYGVCIFFVISGFLICNSIMKRWNTLPEINPKSFYWMRFARIIPLLLALIGLLSILHLTHIDGFEIDTQKTSLGRTIFAALTFHINYLEIAIGYLPASWDVLWSLSIEEFFYIFFPIVCFVCRKEWQIVATLSVFLVLSPIVRTHLYIDNELGDRNYFAYLDTISIGCIAAIITKRIQFSKTELNTISIFGWLSFSLVFLFRKWTSLLGLYKTGLNITILSLGVGLLLIWMQNRHLQNKKPIKSTHFLRVMGRYSYEIYLTHMFVVLVFVKAFGNLSLSGEYIWLLYISTILISTWLGSLVSRYFTDPMNEFLRKKY